MRHTRQEVIQRTRGEFELLDALVANLSAEDWLRPVPRGDAQDPWTVKDTVAHITHWKADVGRKALGRPQPQEERGLNIRDGNRLVYLRWRERSPQQVLAWHRQVHQEVLAALQQAPEKWYNGREHRPDWPGDLDIHSAHHRQKDIEPALCRK